MSANSELLVIAISIVALSAAGIPYGSAHAEEDCLAAPSGRPPPGSQWHYRTDHLQERKCWHLRAQGERGETGTAIATRPAAERPQNPPDHLEDQKLQTIPEAAAGLRGSTAPTSIQDGGAGRPATLPWPDPPSPAAPDNTAWPDPPSPTHAGNVVWPDPPAPIPADKAKGPEAPMLDRNSGGDVGSVKQVAAEMAANFLQQDVPWRSFAMCQWIGDCRNIGAPMGDNHLGSTAENRSGSARAASPPYRVRPDCQRRF